MQFTRVTSHARFNSQPFFLLYLSLLPHLGSNGGCSCRFAYTAKPMVLRARARARSWLWAIKQVSLIQRMKVSQFPLLRSEFLLVKDIHMHNLEFYDPLLIDCCAFWICLFSSPFFVVLTVSSSFWNHKESSKIKRNQTKSKGIMYLVNKLPSSSRPNRPFAVPS